jgi:carbamoyltransferase
MRDRVNLKIKYREPFRPFAPVVPAERAAEVFDLPARDWEPLARSMLLVAPVLPERRAQIPAVTHVDGSGRLQTIAREAEPRYHRLVERFGEETGVPVLLNTSFNLRGEPMVAAPEDAVATFLKSGLDLLVMGDFVAAKE